MYRTLSSELLVDAPVVALRRDRITTATGEATREVVEHFSAAAVVAVRDGHVMLVRQYRRPVGRYLWELPAGLLDMAGEDVLSTARRELAEEAGLGADSWHLLGDVCTSPGISEEMCRIFLAEEVHDLGEEELSGLEEASGEEADMTRVWLPVDEAVDWVRQGRVENAIAVAGLLHLHAGTRRDVTDGFAYRSGLAERRAGGLEHGADMKHVR
ncbi:MAG: NUDIX domain-containing protein [Mycobacteriaceae bacterium]|uniref:NUDIX domain-containing protein n=1 Tax=Corynebacterium sp. TaxID=1720 RepID=UPI003F95D3E4